MRKKWTKRMLYLFSILVIGAIVGFSYSYYEARNIKTVTHNFAHKNLPKAFVGKKLIFLTDTHCNKHYTPEDVEKLVNRVNAMQPDLILLGGDHVDKEETISKPFFKAISKLKSTYGVYSVLGNHDHWEDATLIQQGLQEAGVNTCDNQSYWIHQDEDSIKIGGVGDMWEDSQLIDKTVHDVQENDFCILLSHNPDFADFMDTNKVDLMLSGHTHAGQVTLFGLYAPIMPALWKPHLPQTGQKYRYGWIEGGKSSHYVSSGIGMGEFPFRFFAQPEIVEIILDKK